MPPPDVFIGRTVSHYRLVERIGAGGMGVVYRAEDLRLNRDVALKFLPHGLHADSDARARLEREAQSAAALDHPNLAAVHDIDETEDGRLFIVMGYYPGETLRERIQRGPVPADEALKTAVQVAEGLAEAHRAGIIHRDLKPSNVVLQEDAGGQCCARVLDFGIAKMIGSQLTQPGQQGGSFVYMSPEQLRNAAVDGRTDVWGVGSLLFEMLAGHPPFERLLPEALAHAIPYAPTPTLDRHDVPPHCQTVIDRCLEKNPADRYPSMEALADALRGLDATPLAPARVRALHARLRRPWALIAIGVVAAVLMAALAVLAPRDDASAHQSLVVLPFRAADPDADALSDGLVEAVTSKLGHLLPAGDRIQIVPASEVPHEMKPTEAHERFGVTLVVDGTVQVEGDRVRVFLSLIDVSDGQLVQRGSGVIDDAAGSAFALQDAAAIEVANLLRLDVAPEVRDALAAGGTNDAIANTLYLRGRGELRNQQSTADLDRARDLFQQAIARDSKFALAYAGLAEAEWQTYRRTDEVSWADRAVASAQRALRLDDELTEVHIALGTIHTGRGDYERALESLDRALELAPRDAEAVRRLAKVYAEQDRSREAERAFQQAVALAPRFWRTHNSLGYFYLDEGRAEDAADQFRKALALDPTNLSLHLNLGVAAWYAGDLLEAASAFGDVLRLDSSHAMAAANLTTVRVTQGDYEGAIESGEHAIMLQPNDYEALSALAEARWWSPGLREQARDDYRTVVRLARDHLSLNRSSDLLLVMAGAFAHSGRADSAKVYLAELGRSLSPQTADVQTAFALGVLHEQVGDRSTALEWLSSALSRGYGRAQAERSPWLGRLRDSPDYRALLATSS